MHQDGALDAGVPRALEGDVAPAARDHWGPPLEHRAVRADAHDLRRRTPGPAEVAGATGIPLGHHHLACPGSDEPDQPIGGTALDAHGDGRDVGPDRARPESDVGRARVPRLQVHPVDARPLLRRRRRVDGRWGRRVGVGRAGLGQPDGTGGGPEGDLFVLLTQVGHGLRDDLGAPPVVELVALDAFIVIALGVAGIAHCGDRSAVLGTADGRERRCGLSLRQAGRR